jgi:hypothetical protein
MFYLLFTMFYPVFPVQNNAPLVAALVVEMASRHLHSLVGQTLLGNPRAK